MKKYISLFLVVLLASVSVFSQSIAKPPKPRKKPLPPFSVIFKVGINNSIYTDPKQSTGILTQMKNVTGYNISIYGNWPITQSLSVQAGVKVIQKGTQANSDTLYYHIQSFSKPLYAEIPFNLVERFRVKDKWYMYIGAGPYVAEALGGKNRYSGVSGSLGYSTTLGGDDKLIFGGSGTPYYDGTYGDMQKFDWGVNGVIGVEYWKFSLSFAFEQGLTDVGYGDFVPNINAKTKSMTLALGFHL